jgi:hypothetical protein
MMEKIEVCYTPATIVAFLLSSCMGLEDRTYEQERLKMASEIKQFCGIDACFVSPYSGGFSVATYAITDPEILHKIDAVVLKIFHTTGVKTIVVDHNSNPHRQGDSLLSSLKLTKEK